MGGRRMLRCLPALGWDAAKRAAATQPRLGRRCVVPGVWLACPRPRVLGASGCRKKVLKPPGYKKPPLPPKPKPSGAAAGSAGPKKRARPSSEPPEFVQRRAVRESTRQKVEEGEQERKLLEMVGEGLCWR